MPSGSWTTVELLDGFVPWQREILERGRGVGPQVIALASMRDPELHGCAETLGECQRLLVVCHRSEDNPPGFGCGLPHRQARRPVRVAATLRLCRWCGWDEACPRALSRRRVGGRRGRANRCRSGGSACLGVLACVLDQSVEVLCVDQASSLANLRHELRATACQVVTPHVGRLAIWTRRLEGVNEVSGLCCLASGMASSQLLAFSSVGSAYSRAARQCSRRLDRSRLPADRVSVLSGCSGGSACLGVLVVHQSVEVLCVDQSVQPLRTSDTNSERPLVRWSRHTLAGSPSGRSVASRASTNAEASESWPLPWILLHGYYSYRPIVKIRHKVLRG